MFLYSGQFGEDDGSLAIGDAAALNATGSVTVDRGTDEGVPATVQDQPATTGEFVLRNGHWGGWVQVPGKRIGLSVSARDADLGRRILRTLRFVDTDVAGCPASRLRAPAPTQSLPAQVTAVSLCSYTNASGGDETLIKRSRRYTGGPARQLAAALRRARPGPVSRCPSIPQGLLIFTDAAGGTHTLRVFLHGCPGTVATARAAVVLGPLLRRPALTRVFRTDTWPV
ncbi:hypothetical protein GCM10027589_49380 [Actinocorallia lasiicapitis]